MENAPDLHFLTDWEHDRSRVREAGVLSLATHLVFVVGLFLIPRSIIAPPRHETTRITPLIEPLTELTQKTPNKGKLEKELSVATIPPRPRIQIPPSPPPQMRPPAPQNTPAKAPAPAPIPEPPRIDTAREAQPPRNLPNGPQTAQIAPPPQIQEQEKPKLAFETPTAPTPSGGQGRIAVPDASVAGALRNLAHNGVQGSMTVGDDTDMSSAGGINPGLRLPPSPGRAGSSLQLLSDPMGVDFRPYLLQVLASVRRNWFAVMPESARVGRLRGKVEIQFAISREGSVPKLVIVLPSGAEALDRAAVAGISASNPFPPLPKEFSGSVIRLQFTFAYNIPRN
ncbi:MAG: TonB family protein [Bryobacteraceae bacterium]